MRDDSTLAELDRLQGRIGCIEDVTRALVFFEGTLSAADLFDSDRDLRAHLKACEAALTACLADAVQARRALVEATS